MKALKIIAGILGVIVVLGAGAAVVTPMVVDPNDYKPRIAELAKERTGRDLTIDGDIELSVFPWLGVKMGQVSLGNAPGFAPANFAELDAMQVRVKLMPLLGREVEMDTVHIDGLRLQLARNAEGVNNWDDLARAGQSPGRQSQTGSGSGTGSSAPSTEEGSGDASAVALLGVGGINVKDAALTWNDAASGQVIEVTNLQAETGSVTLGQPVEFSLSMDIAEIAPGLNGRIETSLTVSADGDFQTITASDLTFNAELEGQALAGGKTRITGSAEQGEFDVASQRATVDGLSISAAETGLGEFLKARLDIQTAAAMDLVGQVVSLSEFKAEGALSGKAIPGGNLPFELSATGQANLEQGTVGLGEFRLSVPAISAEGISGKLAVSGAGAGQLDAQRFKLSLTEIAGDFTGETLPGGKLNVRASSELDMDLAAGIVDVSRLDLKAAELEGGAVVKVTGLDAEPQAVGRLELAQFNPRTLAALVGQVLPDTADPGALGSASLTTGFTASPASLTLDELALTLDESTVTGRVSLPDISAQALEFDLQVDKLDADRYLPPPAAQAASKEAANQQSGGAAKAKPTQAGGQAKAPKGEAVQSAVPVTPGASAVGAAGLPVDTLRALDLKGQLRVGQLTAMNVALTDVNLGLTAKNGLIEAKPLTAALYGGTYTGAIRLDASGETASVSVDESLSGVRADKLLAALNIDPGINLGGGPSSVQIKASATGDTAAQVFAFKQLGVTADLAGKGFPKGRLQFGLAADVDLDLPGEKLTARNLDVGFGGAKVNGSISVVKLLGKPNYDADLTVPAFNPRQMLRALGQKPPRTADKKALTSATAKVKAKGGLSWVRLENLDLTLDQSHLTGQLAVSNFANPRFKFDLNLDAIDADRYLPPSGTGKSKKKGKKQKAKGNKNKQAAPAGSAAVLLPAELLRSLHLDGQLKVGRLKLNKLQMTKVVFKAKAKDGKVSLNPMRARLYKGSYAGKVRIDATGKRPRIDFDEKLSNVQAGRLLKALSGKATITGRASFSAKGNAVGPDERSLRRTLNANSSFSFKDGVVRGVDVAAMLCDGVGSLAGSLAGGKVDTDALIGGLLNQVTKQVQPKSAKKAGGKQVGSGAKGKGTRFAELNGTVQVKKGVATNDDLKLRSPLLRVSGSGKANLVKERVNYTAVATLVGSCEGQGALDDKLKGVDIPVRVSGRFDNLKYKPQWDKLASSLAGSSKTSKAAKAGKSGGKAAKRGADAKKASKPASTKDQLENVLQGGLKGLLGN